MKKDYLEWKDLLPPKKYQIKVNWWAYPVKNGIHVVRENVLGKNRYEIVDVTIPWKDVVDMIACRIKNSVSMEGVKNEKTNN